MRSRSPVALLLVIDAAGLSTIGHLLTHYWKQLKLPNLSRLGLGDIVAPEFRRRFSPRSAGRSYAAALNQASATADSLVGHREMVGVLDSRTYALFNGGFPEKYIAELERRIGRGTFFNKMAAGMEAIELNAAEHERTGKPIVYASKCDPLIQLAMNEAVIPVEEQHKIADTAFSLAMEMGVPVTRAIARCYIRTAAGGIVRTSNRHDAVLPIGQKTLVDILRDNNVWTVAVGKTSDLVNTAYHARIKLAHESFIDPSLGLKFVHPGKSDTNPYSVQGTVNALTGARNIYRPRGTFIFTNLVDTDSVYGHTRDISGAVRAIEEIDRILPLFESRLEKGDLFMITADHGMEHRADYGYHSNEPLPFIAARKGFDRGLGGLKTGVCPGLTDIGHVTAQLFGLEKEYRGIIKSQGQ
jgi:phosphopentomutase